MSAAKPLANSKPAHAAVRLPREVVMTLVIAVGLFAAALAGRWVADTLQATTPWAYTLSYGGPIVILLAVLRLFGSRF